MVLLIVMFVRKRSLGTNVNEIPSGHGSRFQTLYGLGRFMAGLGWVVAVLSIFFGIGAMASGELGGAGILIGLLIIFGGALYGIIIVALGQTMQCLVAIESNTRATASNLTPPAVAGSD
ncbi:MAG: hypothetical protein NT025_05295 [bacterium]|nr:hypothetical protein [bacterium]